MGGNETRLCAPGCEGELEDVAGLGHPTSQRVAERVPKPLGTARPRAPAPALQLGPEDLGMALAQREPPLLAPGDQASSATPGSRASSGGPTWR